MIIWCNENGRIFGKFYTVGGNVFTTGIMMNNYTYAIVYFISIKKLFTNKKRRYNIMEVLVRPMTIEDYDQVYALWKTIRGFGIRSIDDSFEGTERFLERNPGTSVVAEIDGRIVGTILCGHDGRTGSFYHVCVDEHYRKRGIGKQMATAAMRALQKERINKISLIAFKKNEIGNQFWHGFGWKERSDINTFDFVLNDENITRFNE